MFSRHSRTGQYKYKLPVYYALLNFRRSKSCHSKNFGTRDLRSANLPHRDNSLPGTPDGSPFSPSKTPARFTASPPPRVASPVRSLTTGTAPGAPRLRANRSLATTPTSPSFPRTASPSGFDSDPEERDTVDGNDFDLRSQGYAGVLSNTGRPGRGGIPRTVPLSPTRKGTYGKSGDREYGDSVASSDTEEQESAQAPREQSEYTPVVLGSSNIGASMMSSYSPKPLMQTATGTRYGAALNGGSGGVKTNVTGSPRKWGAVTPSCAGCGKSVYFAEQVRLFLFLPSYLPFSYRQILSCLVLSMLILIFDL